MYFELCNEQQLECIYAEFGTTAESVKKDVEYLMEWMEKQPHLPNVKDEEFLTHFLIRCKNSVEKTKNKLNWYYTCRAIMNDILCDRDLLDSNMLQVIKISSIVPLPKLTADGKRILWLRIFENQDRELPSAEAFLKAIAAVLDILLKVDNCGTYIVVFDFQNIYAALITLSLTILKRFITLATRTIPMRFQKIYIINLIPAVEPVVNIAKTLLKKDLADKIEIWKRDTTDIVDVIPKDILPSNYGGCEKSLDELATSFNRYCQDEFRDWLLAEDNNKADLTKKSVLQPNKDASLYGIEGTFRKITID